MEKCRSGSFLFFIYFLLVVFEILYGLDIFKIIFFIYYCSNAVESLFLKNSLIQIEYLSNAVIRLVKFLATNSCLKGLNVAYYTILICVAV
mgnify:CR=1 FL=1